MGSARNPSRGLTQARATPCLPQAICLHFQLGSTLMRFAHHTIRNAISTHPALGRDGYNIRTAEELLGHRDLRMTTRYCHLSPEKLRDAVRVLDHRGDVTFLLRYGEN